MDYASLANMREWAARTCARSPDFVIGPSDNPYLLRWYVLPRNEYGNVYLHSILRSDDDRALHDHPWRNTSVVLEGRYFEHLADGSRHERAVGWSGSREATDSHRLEVLPGEYARTLFFTGPKVREWGFHCPHGWRHWEAFTAGEHGELVGRGCD